MTAKMFFSSLQNSMSERAQARVAEKTGVLFLQMGLLEMRRARKLSQESLAQNLHIKQTIGEELEVTAKFQHRTVRINQLSEMDVT